MLTNYKIALAVLFLILAISCNQNSNNTNDTSQIAGVYRKNNIAWSGSFGPCEVNQILTITRNGNSLANVIGTYEVITEPAGGIGAPYIHYVGNYSLNNCSINNTDGIITITYSDTTAPGDLGVISGVSGNLVDNNLTISVTRATINTSTGVFIKQ